MRIASQALVLATLLFVIPATCRPLSHAADSVGKSKARPPKTIVYKNKQYGFKFYLPKSWKGYSVVVSEWSAGVWEPTSGDAEGTQPTRTERGPKITIRHPLWTDANPYQDVPIMVFSLSQWDLVEKGKVVVSAAPVGPGEVGRNSRYVFALPPRYDVADVIGVEEVNDIMRSQPLQPF